MTRHRLAIAPPPPPWRGETGFTLVELLVSLLVMMLVLIAAYSVFEFQSRLAQVQTQVAEMQQSQRIAQYHMMRDTRMAGRGGLPGNVAVEVRNNVGVTETVVDGGPEVVEGSDILIVRGVFTTPLYQLNVRDDAAWTLDEGGPTGSLVVQELTPSGIPHDLQPLLDADLPEALLVASAHEDGVYVVVEVFSREDLGDAVRLDFRYQGGDHADAFMELGPELGPGEDFPDGMRAAAGFFGILEEYRFYIRQVEDQGELTPRLARARVFPGTEVAYRNNLANAQMDIADGVFDLQLALGIDTDLPGDPGRGVVRPEEWLFSDPDQDPDEEMWNRPTNRLGYVRINTLTRTPRPHLGYLAPELTRIEDREYGENFNDIMDRRHRRRHMETIVEMRNV